MGVLIPSWYLMIIIHLSCLICVLTLPMPCTFCACNHSVSGW
ncbi:hypothetical protein CLOSTHATH_00743 [Hungatella hathewayi DSM 13479]|uniref:Uncharacterized protein n=1 Tax=Hungatella hathewayi DSM 13479 TaxID=566550 RepID=D3AAX2_9FIRM|nr:hypothetical protein CLOSTHATH_00743 [Hungatella hathewayi DSM 13479]